MLIAFLLIAIVLRKAGRAAGRRSATKSRLAPYSTSSLLFPLSVGSSPHDNWNTSNNLAAFLALLSLRAHA